MNETFRPRSNFVWAGVSFILIILFAANTFWVSENFAQTFFDLLLCFFLGVIVHLIWIKPKLVLRETEIEIVNPLRTELIAYGDILELQTKWTLAILHTRGSTKVWVAPVSGKRRWIADKKFGWYGSGLPLSESSHGEMEVVSESLNSFSGQAAYMIRERIKRIH